VSFQKEKAERGKRESYRLGSSFERLQGISYLERELGRRGRKRNRLG
jgi:hypothetical protein